MSGSPLDFRFELQQGRPQSFETFELGPPTNAPWIEIPNRYIPRANVSTINRAIDRNLLIFKTGDFTFTARNDDGFFDALFTGLENPQTIWSLRIWRRGEVQMWGVVIGQGSILFDRKRKMVEITVYGLTKLLDMTSASPLKRIFSAMTLAAGATGGATTVLTLNTNISILSGDTLHLTDHVKSEDVTVRMTLPAQQVLLESPVVNSWGVATEVTCTTPWPRYKSVAYLAQKLVEACGVPLRTLKLSNSQFSTLGPTPVNLGGLPQLTTSNPIVACPAEKDGSRFDTHRVDGTYRQASPDADWVQDDATVRAWVDWSRYRLQSEAQPATVLRDPDTAETIVGGDITDPHYCGFDYLAASPVKYNVDHASGRIRQRTFAAGVWGARANFAGPAPSFNAGVANNDIGCELDQGRQQIYMWTTEGNNAQLWLYDIGGGTFTSCRQGDDTATHRYAGFVWVPELDCVIGLRSAVALPVGAGGAAAFEIVAFRNGVRLWKRAFPTILLQQNPQTNMHLIPTHSLRYVNGKLYCVVISDGKAQLVSSGDEFQTYRMRALAQAGAGPRAFGARVNSAYQIACYSNGVQRGLFIAAPFYAGVMPYADFTDISCGEALKKVAIVCNALFRIDDNCEGTFIARDLYEPADVVAIDDLIADRTETKVWAQTALFVKVSGNGVSAVAGSEAFASDGLEIESAFVPNEAFAQSLADSGFAFFGRARLTEEVTVNDRDGRIWQPLDRVTIGGTRFLVYESDKSLPGDSDRLQLLEDVA